MKKNIPFLVFIFLLFCSCIPFSAYCQPDPGTLTNQADLNGRKQGKWIKKNPEDKLVYEGQFKDDIPYGEFSYYDQEGKLKSVLKYENDGKSAWAVSYYPNGIKMAEGKYLDKKKEGTWTYFNEIGQPASEEHYTEGVPVGTWKVLYEGKNVIEEYSFTDGKKAGPWKQYYPGGTVKMEAHYVKGLLQGEVKFYYPSGAIMSSGLYLDDMKEGKWTRFKENGEKESITEYSAGVVTNELILDKTLEQEMQKDVEELKK